MLLALEEAQSVIEQTWPDRDKLGHRTGGKITSAVQLVLGKLDKGELRVAEKRGNQWVVNEWIKKAILLSFRLHKSRVISGGAGGSPWFDKIASKFHGWRERQFETAGFRAVPGCFVRHGAYVAPQVVLMPSFVNIGAYVGEGTMIDTWATIGSCAQIGKNCHISGGVGIGGVLEPLQAAPVIIEDNVFIGARSEVAEGVVVEEGAVLSMGVYLGASTKIIDRTTGETFTGRVPAYSVVVPGSLPSKLPQLPNGMEKLPDALPAPSLYCAVIVKRVDAQTRAKTAVNELLRD